MTKTSSRHSSRSRSRSSRSQSPHSEYSDRRNRSSCRSRSPSSRSRTRSRSGSGRSRSWSRSRSNSRWRYASQSRSRSRSRSFSSFDTNLGSPNGRRRSYSRSDHSFSRSRSSSLLRSHSRSSSRLSSTNVKSRGKDPRDRSKRVKWPNGVWLVGERARDTTFHFCDLCDLPIVIYGRLLPCKHVFCYTCALSLSSKCNRCQKSVQNVERCLVGGIFMCFRSDSCRRTYLSQRDLQAHIDHRHRSTQASSISIDTNTTAVSLTPATVTVVHSNSIITGPMKPVPSPQKQQLVEANRQLLGITPNPFPVNSSGATCSSTGIMGMTPQSLSISTTSPPPSEFVGKASGLLPLPPNPHHLVQAPIVSGRHRVGIGPRGPSTLIPPSATAFPNFHTNNAIPSSLIKNIPVMHPPPPLSASAPAVSTSPSSTTSVPATITALAMAAAASLSAQTAAPESQQLSVPPGNLNFSLLSNALRAVDPSWSQQSGAPGVAPMIRGSGPLTAFVPQTLPPGQPPVSLIGNRNSSTSAVPPTQMNRLPF